MAGASRAGWLTAAALVGGAVALRAWVLLVVRVGSGSMQPTLPEGAWVLVNRLARPEVGDLVVVRPPGETELLVRRVVAQGPGQVELVDGQLYLDGAAVGQAAGTQIWTEAGCARAQAPGQEEGVGARRWTVARGGEHPPLTLGEGELWVLCDRRTVRADSRQWGALTASELVGVVEWELFRPRSCAR